MAILTNGPRHTTQLTRAGKPAIVPGNILAIHDPEPNMGQMHLNTYDSMRNLQRFTMVPVLVTVIAVNVHQMCDMVYCYIHGCGVGWIEINALKRFGTPV